MCLKVSLLMQLNIRQMMGFRDKDISLYFFNILKWFGEIFWLMEVILFQFRRLCIIIPYFLKDV